MASTKLKIGLSDQLQFFRDILPVNYTNSGRLNVKILIKKETSREKNLLPPSTPNKVKQT